LLLFPFVFLNLLLVLLEGYVSVVEDGLVKSFLEQARLVLKLHCEVRTESWHVVVVNVLFTDHFVHKLVLWQHFWFWLLRPWDRISLFVKLWLFRLRLWNGLRLFIRAKDGWEGDTLILL